MSRGDEIEPGEPRKSGWASDNYQEPADQDERLHLTKPKRSGAVTAVGVIAIIWGAWTLLGAGCLAVLPIVLPAVMEQAAKANPNDPNLAKAKEIMDRTPRWYLLTMAGVQVITGLALAICGAGVLMRSNAARLMLVVLAVLGIVILAGNLTFNVVNGLMDQNGIIGSVCGGVLALGFAALVLIVLLNPKNAAEFRS
jgi:hypothetical protein